MQTLKKDALIIAHRGNLSGPNEKYENSPRYIEEAIKEGFNVEIDVWVLGNDIYLGHDRPTFLSSLNWLENNYYDLWCHCKNFNALQYLLNHSINCFYHTNEDYVLTSHSFIWTYPNQNLYLSNNSIAVMPEKVKNWDIKNACGVCTDYALLYKNLCIE